MLSRHAVGALERDGSLQQAQQHESRAAMPLAAGAQGHTPQRLHDALLEGRLVRARICHRLQLRHRLSQCTPRVMDNALKRRSRALAHGRAGGDKGLQSWPLMQTVQERFDVAHQQHVVTKRIGSAHL